jgi:uncharacterized protein YndB with AHSA1/START domain
MQRDLVIKWQSAHPPEKVWKFLTDPALINQWLMKNDFQPIGHKFLSVKDSDGNVLSFHQA